MLAEIAVTAETGRSVVVLLLPGGPAIAVKAMAAKLARLVYNMLRHGMEYVDRGTEFYEQQQRERRVYALTKNAAQLGFQLVPATR